MNKNYLLIAVLMSVGMMTSCSSSDTEETPTVGNPAVVNLQLNGKSITRSTPSDNEKYIKEGQAAAFDASGAIVGTVQSFLTSKATTPTINTTTQATQVSVVANPGTTATTASFESILNKGGLEAVTTDLASTATAATTANSQDPNKLPKYGNSSVDFSTNTSVDQPVDMYNLVGKIKLNPIVIDFGGTAYDGANFEPKEVFLYDANTTSTFGGIGSDPQSGENTDKTGTYAVTDPNSFYYLSSGVISSTTGTYTFYTFPNASTTNPTKIVIKGAFTPKDGSTVLVYYPIVINRFQTGTVIKKGGNKLDEADANDSKIVKSTSYDVTITIKGKGVDSPASNISPASAKITMNVNDWTDYTQAVIVN